MDLQVTFSNSQVAFSDPRITFLDPQVSFPDHRPVAELGPDSRSQPIRGEWPGLHCVRQLADGELLAGTWFDRTQEYAARRRRGEDPDPSKYATPETVTLSPLPCWKHLSPEAYRERVAQMAAEIEEDAAAARKRAGAEPLGPAAILAQDPVSRPKRVKKSPAPLFHAASQAMRHFLYEGFVWFVAAYRTAAEKLQRGDPEPRFPAGSFPPALPFVSG